MLIPTQQGTIVASESPSLESNSWILSAFASFLIWFVSSSIEGGSCNKPEACLFSIRISFHPLGSHFYSVSLSFSVFNWTQVHGYQRHQLEFWALVTTILHGKISVSLSTLCPTLRIMKQNWVTNQLCSEPLDRLWEDNRDSSSTSVHGLGIWTSLACQGNKTKDRQVDTHTHTHTHTHTLRPKPGIG